MGSEHDFEEREGEKGGEAWNRIEGENPAFPFVFAFTALLTKAGPQVPIY